ncbi:MAG: hypothetical protein U5J83_15795 [Bryobacterales bacterium]|nr:hypothetical protein [Bryobacterales bacterium]
MSIRTAMMLFFNDANDRGQIKDAEWVRLGKAYGIPTFNDCAADVPPVENLTSISGWASTWSPSRWQGFDGSAERGPTAWPQGSTRPPASTRRPSAICFAA